jgi:ankyrin repeat protein
MEMKTKPTLQEIFDNHQIDSNDSEWDANNLDLQFSGEDAIIHWVARYGTSDELGVLIELGASINLRGDIGRTALIEAVDRDKIENVRTLLEFGADITIIDDYGDSAFDIAELYKNAQILNLLKIAKSDKRRNS